MYQRGIKLRVEAGRVFRICFVLVTGLTGSIASAQQVAPVHDPDSFLNQQRAVDERLRRQFDLELGQTQQSLFDWGGWYSRHVFLFDDGVDSSRTLRRHDLRLWGRLILDEGAHTFYARGRLSLLDFNSGDSYDRDDDDGEGPNLERGIYRFDLARAVRVHAGDPIDYNLIFQAGRDLTYFGTGLALSTPLDHLSLRGTYGDVELTALAGKTVGSSQDFDLSRTAGRLRRTFLGGQIRYRGFERHEPFVYAFWQRDHNREAFARPLRSLNYDSFYFGLGSTGEVVSHLRYATELVYETGKSHSPGVFQQDQEIRAWAAGVELEYLFPNEHKTRASVEYVFGSGDSDRLASPTNTLGRRRRDSRDESFIGIGYRDTGLSFAPRYSNLHMWRMGASYYPWPNHPRFRRIEMGTDWYLYYKNRGDGAVSDPTADVRSSYLGWEMDYFVNWRVDADLAWTARFGAFFPGKAFSDRTTRTFLLVGMTWSF